MFRHPTTNPLPPHPKAARFEIRSHYPDYISLRQPNLLLNLIEACAVLPSHSDYSVFQFLIHPSPISLFPENASRDDFR